LSRESVSLLEQSCSHSCQQAGLYMLCIPGL